MPGGHNPITRLHNKGTGRHVQHGGIPKTNVDPVTGGRSAWGVYSEARNEAASGRPPGADGYNIDYSRPFGSERTGGDTTGGGASGGGGGGGAAGSNPLAGSGNLKGVSTDAFSGLTVEDATAIAQGAKSTKKQRMKAKNY